MNEQHHRPIRSFVRREGKITKRQRFALNELLPQYLIQLEPGHFIEFDKIFHRVAPLSIEIGFGNGEALLEVAKTHPENDYIGIEVYRPGVGALLPKVAEAGLTNLRVIVEDATVVFNEHIPDSSLEAVMLYFPDPWHKQRHKKRRIIRPEFINLVVNKLKNNGKWYLATDWEDYALQMLKEISSCEKLRNLAPSGEFSQRNPLRPLTKFEKRGKRLGHGVWDLVFQKI